MTRRVYIVTLILAAALTIYTIACHSPQSQTGPQSSNITQTQSQAENDTVSLGKKLFFDPILSADRSISCANCHRPNFAFADTSAVSIGVGGKKGPRNTPSAMNLDGQPNFFWDGRAATLEAQALIPIANPIEMNLPLDSAIHRLQQSPSYTTIFNKLFGQTPNPQNLGLAIAAFEKTLETSNTPFDDWRINDNAAAVSESAKRGYTLFNTKAGCIRCHFGTNFNNREFRNIGLYDGRQLHDSGRAAITHNPADLGRFKIGPLRNIGRTAPYMHNGMFKSLREVIDYYNDPDKIVPHPINRDSLLSKPLYLTDSEKIDLEAFLRSLTDRQFNTKD